MQPSYASTGETQRPPLKHRTTSVDGVARTKIILLGLRRSGKTSIQQVLFNNLAPKESFFLETTIRLIKHPIDTVVPLELWDYPGNITVETLDTSLAQFATMIFVIDIRDLYQHAISRLVEFILAAYQDNPDINIEVFVHKAERLAEDDKIENFRQINERVTDRLVDSLPDFEAEQIPLNFHLTSVYDHTLHEAFSRVLQRLITTLPYLEELLNVFCVNSQSPKAFLFDIKSKLFIATDASPVDSATHNLFCDYLQTLNALAPLYKSYSKNDAEKRDIESSHSSISSSTTSNSLNSPPSTSTDNPTSLTLPIPKPPIYPSAAARLNPPPNGTTLTYHLITPHLALLSQLPTAVYESKRGLLEYNVVFLREGVRDISVVEWEGSRKRVERDGTT